MAISLHFSVYGDVQVERELLRFAGRADNLSDAFPAIHRSFLAIERQQFASQGRYSGGWPPLAPSTIRRKARLGHDPRILHATLALRKSLTQQAHPDHVYLTGPDWLVMGTSVKSPKGYPYAKAHQLGRGVPRRRPIELVERHKRNWMKVLQRFIRYGSTSTGVQA